MAGRDMFREVYVYYSPMYAGPDGNLCTAFWVSDRMEQPVINGVPIPEMNGHGNPNYVVRKEVEIDLGMCTPRQFHGILGKFLLTIASTFYIT